jgi:hypothetical protein
MVTHTAPGLAVGEFWERTTGNNDPQVGPTRNNQDCENPL